MTDAEIGARVRALWQAQQDRRDGAAIPGSACVAGLTCCLCRELDDLDSGVTCADEFLTLLEELEATRCE